MSPRALRRAEVSERPAPAAAGGVTARALLLGLLAAAGWAVVAPYLSFRMTVWLPGSDSLMYGPVLVVLALIAANGGLARWWPHRAFSRTELLVIYSMLIVSLGWLTKGGLPFLLGMIAYPFYRATPANGWEQLILPYIPPWLQLGSQEAITWFWEGRPRDVGVPWLAWREPMLVWSAFTLALMVAALCAASLLRKDWIERQRLTFPLAEIPLAMVGEEDRPTLVSSGMARRMFLLGFAIPAALGFCGWLSRFWPAVPSLNLYQIPVGLAVSGSGLPWNVLKDVNVTIAWATLGIMCLIPSEVSLSLGLFYVLNELQLVGWAAAGVGGGQNPSSIDPIAFTSFEQAGALIALGGLLIYESRHSLRSAWMSLRRGSAEGDSDPTSPMPGRLAVIGFLGANAFMLWCCLWLGMSWWVFVTLLGLFYMSMLVGSKLIAAGGVLSYQPGLYCFERQVMVGVMGTRLISPASLIMTGYVAKTYMDDPANLAMPQMMNAMKLSHSSRIRGKQLSWAMLAAIAVVMVVGFIATMAMVYRYGASAVGTAQGWPFGWAGDAAFGDIDAALRNPGPGVPWQWLALSIGGVVMLGLSWLQLNVVWWPVSPVGLVIASGWATANEIWGCALIGWMLTTLIRRYGGLRLYRKLRPAFLGLVIGDVLTYSATGILNVLVDYKKLIG